MYISPKKEFVMCLGNFANYPTRKCCGFKAVGLTECGSTFHLITVAGLTARLSAVTTSFAQLSVCIPATNVLLIYYKRHFGYCIEPSLRYSMHNYKSVCTLQETHALFLVCNVMGGSVTALQNIIHNHIKHIFRTLLADNSFPKFALAVLVNLHFI